VRWLFGAHGQLVVGALLVVATCAQAWWWGIHTKPGAEAIFWLSVEALLFAAYSIFATALGYRATERVEAHVIENVTTNSLEVER
jgi:hypothetical protein